MIATQGDLRAVSLELVRSVLPTPKPIRLVGVTVSNFEGAAPSKALELFGPEPAAGEEPAEMALS